MTAANSEINLMRVFQTDKEPGSENRFFASRTGHGADSTGPVEKGPNGRGWKSLDLDSHARPKEKGFGLRRCNRVA